MNYGKLITRLGQALPYIFAHHADSFRTWQLKLTVGLFAGRDFQDYVEQFITYGGT